MSKFPTVNYIGNKQKIVNWIIENMPIKTGKVLDLFCGGCSVSYALKENGYNVISNDALYSNYVLAKAIVENKNVKLELNDLDIDFNCNIDNIYERIKFLSNKIYFEEEVEELAYLINHSYKMTEYKKYMFLALLRRAMIRKIPYSRMNVKWKEIQKFRDEEYSYQKYGRYRHYHNISFLEHIKLNMREYNTAVFEKKPCNALCMDAIECIEHLDKVDLIYMDPPYPGTMNNYTDFYGYYDKMFTDENNILVDLTRKDTFLDNFYTLIEKTCGKTKYVVISLNNKCYPTCDTLVEKIRHLTKSINIIKKDHVYKVTGKENKNSNYEILIVCEMV